METVQIPLRATIIIATLRRKTTGRPAPARTVRTARSTRTIPTGRTRRPRISLSTPSRTRRMVRTRPRIIRTGIARTAPTATPATRILRGRRSRITSSSPRSTRTAVTQEAARATELANTAKQNGKGRSTRSGLSCSPRAAPLAAFTSQPFPSSRDGESKKQSWRVTRVLNPQSPAPAVRGQNSRP
jgi:hypothetical protein